MLTTQPPMPGSHVTDSLAHRAPRATTIARHLLGNLALAAVYFGLARLALAAATEHRVVSSIWPPSGVALFALLRFGLNYAPGAALGAFALNATSGVGAVASGVIAIGDAVEPLVGAILFRRVASGNCRLDRVREVVALALLAAGGSTLIAATIGVGTLVLSGAADPSAAFSLWLVWWTGDAVGVLIVTPLLLTWTSPEQSAGVKAKALEAVLVFVVIALLTNLVFGNDGMRAFAVYPVAIWAGWRLGPRGAATAAALVTLIAAWRTLGGYGPFIGETPTSNLFTLQLFLALLALKALLFAAARAESQQHEAELVASELRYKGLAQNLPDGCVVLYDRELRILLAEGPALEAAGFTKSSVEGRRLAELFDASHASALTAPFLAAIDGGEVEFEFAYAGRVYMVRVLPMPDAAGNQTLGMALALDVTRRDAAQRELEESKVQLERLSRLLLTAQEDERRRVAREVHDELGQALTAVKIGLAQTLSRARLRQSLESERRVSNAADVLDRAIESVQRIVLRLRPGVLDNLGPLAALEYEVDQFREQSGLHVALRLPDALHDISAEQSTTLYRIVQEALTNVMRHARASRVDITVAAAANNLVLDVTDDGIGISADQLQKPRSMGILGMRERAAACGGRVEIIRNAAGGTRVTLRLPIGIPHGIGVVSA